MLNTLFTGHNFINYPELPSTNTEALKLLDTYPTPAEGTVVSTRTQLQGRGQKGNQWYTTPGKNLTLSLIYYPSFLSVDEMFQLSKMVSLALRNTVALLLPHTEVTIKWPNDILIQKRKVAGILIENQVEGGNLKSSVIGIGLNVNQDSFPPLIADYATSLLAWAEDEFPLENVQNVLFEELESGYLALRRGELDLLSRRYYEHLYGYQETVPIRIDNKSYKAEIIGVDKGGRLAVNIEERLRFFDIKELSFIL